MISDPESTFKVSFPPPPLRVSSPSPPVMVSSPDPPVKSSVAEDPATIKPSSWLVRTKVDPELCAFMVSILAKLSLFEKVCVPVNN